MKREHLLVSCLGQNGLRENEEIRGRPKADQRAQWNQVLVVSTRLSFIPEPIYSARGSHEEERRRRTEMICVGSGHYLTPPSVTSERVHLFTKYDRKCEKQTEITRKEIFESRIRKTNERVGNNRTRHEDKQRKLK